MSSSEQRLSPEPVQPEVVYAKATELLNEYGQHAIEKGIMLLPRPGGRPRNRLFDIPIIHAPITPIEIAGREYRLWLKRDTRPSRESENIIQLSVHYQQQDPNVDKVEYDEEGRVSDYWYKQEGHEEPIHVQVVKSRYYRPKELDFDWYLARYYKINPASVECEVSMNVPEDISAPLGDGSDFVYGLLEQMQLKLRS